MKARAIAAAALLGAVTMATGGIAPKPLFRDPVYDGAADPVIVWNRAERRWYMLYTNRRANAEGLKGVEWVHGTRVGVATSPDGAKWEYKGVCKVGYGGEEDAHWAPDVVWDGGRYHMFLTVVPGMHRDWNADRRMVHLTSADLMNWGDAREIKLSSDRVIDASVVRMPDGEWRMWYNDERDHKGIWWARSKDMKSWEVVGRALTGAEGGEGPKVFQWRGTWWMVVDHWKGFGVYRSDDAINWEKQGGEKLLSRGGTGKDDGVMGNHCDVVVSGDRAYLYYFTHPGRVGADAKKDAYEQRRSSIQVVELREKDGVISCDRDQPQDVVLEPVK